ncbi:L-threonylcarbamoyladenylate synthase [Halocella sp. SP3-1]|uniref:L-threonylcarbamoyladenylate synthase n=1 Tax=Halocella sp. SP3-1 TaxID=2382161 RepID=UPI000F74EB99|nr:L-threonylcarbamoyladenylate synthase [Halocella sp. SP3-1]AZO93935.1 threonylcarbamoyl-AMP synthase [Halocella sp. SP3-1]
MDYTTVLEKIDESLLDINKIDSLKRHRVIKMAAALLQQGELVAFPTETVYGLGADAGSGEAVARIFQVKGRPQDNPLIVHIAGKKQLVDITVNNLSATAEKLIERFWPGPLTLIMEKSPLIAAETTAGLASVAVRMPSHPVALALIEESGFPLAAPSANRSGAPSPTLAGHVLDDLKGRIPLIVGGGPCSIGVESTVLDVRGNQPLILRPGGISREEIEEVLGYHISSAGAISKDSNKKPASPGMKYRHYSPETPVYLKKLSADTMAAELAKYQGEAVAFLITDETACGLTAVAEELLEDKVFMTMGSRYTPERYASQVFAVLRKLDRLGLTRIIAEEIPERGLGAAVMNRLQKASLKE